MREQEFVRLKNRIRRDLTLAQHLEIEYLVRDVASAQVGQRTIADLTRQADQARKCPRCGQAGAVRYGRDQRGRQRFRCRREGDVGCGRTFNALTGTGLARLRHPEKWGAYARLLTSGFQSVANVAETGHMGLSPTTIWKWRHRFLSPLAAPSDSRLSGVIEVDETFFRRAFKGHRGWTRGQPPIRRKPRYRGGRLHVPGLSPEFYAPVLTALDSSGTEFNRVLMNRGQIWSTMLGRVEAGSMLCSDGAPAYGFVADASAAEHRRFVRSNPDDPDHERIEEDESQRLGLGHVDAHHQRMKNLINVQIRGVSTRYLHRYIAWLRIIRDRLSDPSHILDRALRPIQVLTPLRLAIAA